MSEYIKRDDAIDWIKSIREENSTIEEAEGLTIAENALADVPTADVVEVVRCKDCKHLYKDGECPLRTWFTHDEDDYCSYGERKEQEHETEM